MHMLQGTAWYDTVTLGSMGKRMLCQPLPLGAPRVSAACSNMYLQGLADTARLLDKAVKEDTKLLLFPFPFQKEHNISLGADTSRNACSGWPTAKDLQTLTPEDLAVYLTQHWLPTHAGSTANNGQQIAAPSSLAGVKSHFSTEFELLGRTGEWNASTQQGNPTWRPQTRRLTKGYKTMAEEQGYQQKGAVP